MKQILKTSEKTQTTDKYNILKNENKEQKLLILIQYDCIKYIWKFNVYIPM